MSAECFERGDLGYGGYAHNRDCGGYGPLSWVDSVNKVILTAVTVVCWMLLLLAPTVAETSAIFVAVTVGPALVRRGHGEQTAIVVALGAAAAVWVLARLAGGLNRPRLYRIYPRCASATSGTRRGVAAVRAQY